MPAPWDNLWVSDGSLYRKPYIAYTYNGTSWRRVKKVYARDNDGWYLVAQYPDWAKVATGITNAASGIQPDAFIFNELINGRKLGDIDNNGSVNAIDALRATQFNSYALAAGAQKTYIESVIGATLMRNQGYYAAYF